MYGFLANVRNYSAVPFLSEPRGLCEDISKELLEHATDADGWGFSWLLLSELLDFDYDQEFEDRRVTIKGDGGCTAEPGGGRMTTYREFLTKAFFEDLEAMAWLGAPHNVRVVFWFN